MVAISNITDVKNIPSNGMVSEAAGIISATININTDIANRRVSPSDTLSPNMEQRIAVFKFVIVYKMKIVYVQKLLIDSFFIILEVMRFKNDPTSTKKRVPMKAKIFFSVNYSFIARLK